MLVSVLMVACSKEEVAPFNPASGSGTAILRDGEGSTDTGLGTPTNEDGTPVTGEGGTEEGGDDTGGITDGGNSSDFDSKSKKKKS